MYLLHEWFFGLLFELFTLIKFSILRNYIKCQAYNLTSLVMTWRTQIFSRSCKKYNNKIVSNSINLTMSHRIMQINDRLTLIFCNQNSHRKWSLPKPSRTAMIFNSKIQEILAKYQSLKTVKTDHSSLKILHNLGVIR